jgi:hypothetical protein
LEQAEHIAVAEARLATWESSMQGIIGLSLVAWWAVGLVLAAEPVAPAGPLAVWDQCRDEALVAHHQQTLVIIKRCFPGDKFVCTEDEVRALPEADALILDRCGPEPLTAKGALQARSCDMLFRFACLTPNVALLSAKVATLDPRALGEKGRGEDALAGPGRPDEG